MKGQVYGAQSNRSPATGLDASMINVQEQATGMSFPAGNSYRYQFQDMGNLAGSGLPGGGYVIDGLYDIKPEKFGVAADPLITLDRRYGRIRDTWDGVTASVNARPGGEHIPAGRREHGAPGGGHLRHRRGDGER